MKSLERLRRFLDSKRRVAVQKVFQARSPERAKFTKALAEAKPNPGHFALVELEKMGKLDTIITQNVDGLHRIAGNNNVAEIHGNRNYYRCLDCSSRFLRDEFTIIDIPPKCPNCQGMIKGDGVMFGEPIPSDVLARCITAAQNCDAMLVLGTSGAVFPAASFPSAPIGIGDAPSFRKLLTVFAAPPGRICDSLYSRMRTGASRETLENSPKIYSSAKKSP